MRKKMDCPYLFFTVSVYTPVYILKNLRAWERRESNWDYISSWESFPLMAPGLSERGWSRFQWTIYYPFSYLRVGVRCCVWLSSDSNLATNVLVMVISLPSNGLYQFTVGILPLIPVKVFVAKIQKPQQSLKLFPTFEFHIMRVYLW